MLIKRNTSNFFNRYIISFLFLFIFTKELQDQLNAYPVGKIGKKKTSEGVRFC